MKLKRNIAAVAMALSLVAGTAFATGHYGPKATTCPGFGMKGQGMMGDKRHCCFRKGDVCGMWSKGMKHGKRGMHHGRAMMNPEMLEKRNQFLDATVELRKQLHDKKFAHREATRDPAMTQGELRAQEKEIYTMHKKLKIKYQETFTAQ